MPGSLDWKWIGIGVVIMVVLSLIAGVILSMVLGAQLEGATSPEDVTLSGGQTVLVAVLNILAFAIGGFIVGIKSAGRTILEPGISAAVAVVIALSDLGQLHARQHHRRRPDPVRRRRARRLARRAPAGHGLSRRGPCRIGRRGGGGRRRAASRRRSPVSGRRKPR